jgi:uncharacterized membrane protein
VAGVGGGVEGRPGKAISLPPPPPLARWRNSPGGRSVPPTDAARPGRQSAMSPLLDYEIPFLHPLLVHFPIVLILLGAGAAALYGVLGRGAWRRTALVLFTLGAVSAWAAVETGPPLADALRGDPVVDRIVGTHAAAAEGALAASAFAAALFALLSALALRRRPPAGEGGGRGAEAAPGAAVGPPPRPRPGRRRRRPRRVDGLPRRPHGLGRAEVGVRQSMERSCTVGAA